LNLTKYYFNVEGLIPSSHFEASARVVIAVASADGDFSELEKNAFLSILKIASTPDDILAKVEGFFKDPKAINLNEELGKLQGDHDASRRHLVYASTVVASADGFDDKERALVYQVGEKLGVDKASVDGIINGVLKENEGRLERLKFMGNQKF